MTISNDSSSHNCQRRTSILKIVVRKTKLRSTMKQDRLESLLATAEKDILVQLSIDDLVFAAAADSRLGLG